MATVKIVTDSNSGITQAEAKELGISVIPMPFLINGEDFLEDINLTQAEFYKHLEGEANVSTSQPAVATVTDLWDSLLAEGDDVEIVHIPMSSGLSESCHTAIHREYLVLDVALAHAEAVLMELVPAAGDRNIRSDVRRHLLERCFPREIPLGVRTAGELQVHEHPVVKDNHEGIA